MKKFRIDVYERFNPDKLINRNYQAFRTEKEAYEYGLCIAQGNIFNVIEDEKIIASSEKAIDSREEKL